MSTFSPVLESLEKRLAPAGLVTAILANGVLKITGSADADQVEIIQNQNGINISGNNGTLVQLNGGTATSAPQSLTGPLTSVIADLGAGNDTLAMRNVVLTKDLTVNLGAGDNELIFNGSIDGNATVSGLAGKDTVKFDGNNVSIGGKVAINLGDGTNSAYFGGTTVTLGKGLSYAGGSGNDKVELFGSTDITVGGAMDVKMGAGTAKLYMGATNILVKGPLNYTTLDHKAAGENSTFEIFGSHLNVQGAMSIKNGLGISKTTISPLYSLTVLGNLSIANAGQGMQTNTINGYDHGTFIKGNLSIVNGAGAHQNQLSIAGTVTGNLSITNGLTDTGATTSNTISGNRGLDVGGNVTIANANGAQTHFNGDVMTVKGALSVSILNASGQNATFQTSISPGYLKAGSVNLNLGPGSHSTSLSYGQWDITGALVVKHGSNAGTFAGGGTSLSLSTTTLHAGSIAITHGDGHFSTSFSVGNELMVDGGVSIVHGNSLPPAAGGAAPQISVSLTSPLYNIGKNLSITNGQGNNTVSIGGSHMTIEGGLNITNGHSRAGITSSVSLTLTTLHVQGATAIKHGDGLYNTTVNGSHLKLIGGFSLTEGKHSSGSATHNLTAETLFVGKGTKFVSAGGDTNTTISAGKELILHGGVNVTRGEGSDTLWLNSQKSADISGNVALNMGAGGSQSNINAPKIFLKGGVTVNALAGRDNFTLYGHGTVTGAVNVNLGSDLGTINMGGVNTTLAVNSAINVTMGAGTELSLTRVIGEGALSVKGSANGDTVSIVNSTIRGATKLDLLGGADTLSINGSTFHNAVSILTGAGNDQVLIETDATNTAKSFFEGEVKVDMGADNDTLRLAPTVSANLKNYFRGKTTFNGGAGANTLNYLAANNIVSSLPPVFQGFAQP